MLCAKPFTLSAGFEVPCGKCMNCRVNRRRFWTGRILAEAAYQPMSSFWGLSYAPEFVPFVGTGRYADALTLRPEDLTNFIKRWRKAKPKAEPFRYFAVGEYGELGRPHYHIVAFGPRLDTLLEDRIRKAWSVYDRQSEKRTLLGRVSVSELIPERAAYCAGYTIKKMTGHGDSRLLDGQHPEFFRVSRRPPLGHMLFEDIARSTFTRSGSIKLSMEQDVPKEFRQAGARYPLGRYWVSKLREVLDVPTPEYIAPSERYPDYAERFKKAQAKERQLQRKYASKTGARRDPTRAKARITREDVIS